MTPGLRPGILKCWIQLDKWLNYATNYSNSISGFPYMSGNIKNNIFSKIWIEQMSRLELKHLHQGCSCYQSSITTLSKLAWRVCVVWKKTKNIFGGPDWCAKCQKNHGYSLQTEGCIKTQGQCSLEGQSDVINCQKILSEHLGSEILTNIKH